MRITTSILTTDTLIQAEDQDQVRVIQSRAWKTENSGFMRNGNGLTALKELL